MGDVVAQMSTRQPGQRYNYIRTARMTAFGLGFAGPLQGHYWYTWLDKASRLSMHIPYYGLSSGEMPAECLCCTAVT